MRFRRAFFAASGFNEPEVFRNMAPAEFDRMVADRQIPSIRRL
jgi:hypothetical protein